MCVSAAPQEREDRVGAVAASGMELAHRDPDRGLGQRRTEGHALHWSSTNNSINSKPVTFNLFTYVLVVLGMKPRALPHPGKHCTPKPYTHTSPVEKPLVFFIYVISFNPLSELICWTSI